MQCPTCGMTTPGMQERCAHCDAPLPQQAYGGQHTAMPGSWQGPAAPGSLPPEPFSAQPTFSAQPMEGHPSAPLPLGAPVATPVADGEAQPADANEPTAPWSIQDDESEATHVHQPGWSAQTGQPQSSQPQEGPFQFGQPQDGQFHDGQFHDGQFHDGQFPSGSQTGSQTSSQPGETSAPPTASIVPDDWFVDARPPVQVADQTATNPYDTSNASVPLDPWMEQPVERGSYGPQPAPFEQGQYGPQPAQAEPFGHNPMQAEPFGHNPAQAEPFGSSPTQVEQFGSNPTRVQQFGPPPTQIEQYGAPPTQVQGGFGANPTQVEQAPFGPQDTRLEPWGSPQPGWEGGGHAPPGQNQTAVMGAPAFGPGPNGPGLNGPGLNGPGPNGPGTNHGGPQGPGGYGPGFPPPPGGAPARGRKNNKPLVVAVAGIAAVAVVAVAWISLSGGGSGKSETPTGSSTAAADKNPDKTGGNESHSQAVAVNEILDASLRSRSQINGALSRARKCDGIDPAISTMQQVSSDRQNQIQRANALKLTKLKQGDQIRSTLIKAITTSADADNAFLKWAQADHGCKGKPKGNSDQRQGYELSNTASADKKEFVRYWNPVAEKEGLNRRAADSF